MAERDDPVSKRYRALPREEPPAALDAAILAASRRAVGSRPGGIARWAVPVSIAAVLVLGIGVSLRMQVEEPGVESALPQSEYAMPAPTDEVRPQAAAKEAAPAPAKIAPPPAAKPPAAARSPIPARSAERAAPAPPAPAAPPQSAAGAAPRMTAPTAAEAPAPAQAAPSAMRAKREAAADANVARSMAAPDPLREELERIARLRDEHRDDEADKALEEFGRKYPDYRIPEAMRERLRRR